MSLTSTEAKPWWHLSAAVFKYRYHQWSQMIADIFKPSHLYEISISSMHSNNSDTNYHQNLERFHPFVKTSQSFGAWSCMRYSRPLDLILHHPLKFVNRLTTRIVQQLLDVYVMRLACPLSILPALPSHNTRCFTGWSSHR